MTLLPEVRETLLAVVEARASGSAKSSWRRRGARSGGSALLGVAVAGSAIAATSVWSPQVGDEQRGTPSLASGPLPPEQLASLAVLRRAQSAADRGPEARAALKLLVAHEEGGIHLDGVRLLSRHAGGALVLIPQARSGSHDPGYASSIERDVLVLNYSQRLPTASATVRRLADGSRRRVTYPGGNVTASTSGTADQLRRNDIVSVTRVGTRWRVYGLVPDHVAAVRRDGAPEAAQVRVHDNSFELLLGSAMPTTHLQWLDRQGRVIGGS